MIWTCVDCREQFVIDEMTQKWFLDLKLQFPRRCKRCRALRKEMKGKTQLTDESDPTVT